MTETGKSRDHLAAHARIRRGLPYRALHAILGIGTLAELQRRSVADPDWYWDAVVRDLGLRWSRVRTRAVRDVSRGLQWPRWFPGGLHEPRRRTASTATSTPGAATQPGDHLGRRTTAEPGRLTLRASSAREVNRLANALQRLGVGAGDRVGVFLPMSPGGGDRDARGASRIGAIYTPCFSGYGAQAVATRLSGLRGQRADHRRRLRRRGQIVNDEARPPDEAVAAVPDRSST